MGRRLAKSTCTDYLDTALSPEGLAQARAEGETDLAAYVRRTLAELLPLRTAEEKEAFREWVEEWRSRHVPTDPIRERAARAVGTD